jgi:hypothetical protein
MSKGERAPGWAWIAYYGLFAVGLALRFLGTGQWQDRGNDLIYIAIVALSWVNAYVSWHKQKWVLYGAVIVTLLIVFATVLRYT